MTEGTATQAARARSRWADWRVWFGVGVTVLCLWIAMRDLPLGEVRAALGRADLWLLVLLSVPAQSFSESDGTIAINVSLDAPATSNITAHQP